MSADSKSPGSKENLEAAMASATVEVTTARQKKLDAANRWAADYMAKHPGHECRVRLGANGHLEMEIIPTGVQRGLPF